MIKESKHDGLFFQVSHLTMGFKFPVLHIDLEHRRRNLNSGHGQIYTNE